MDGWISLLLGSIRDHHLSPVWAGGRGEEGGGRREEGGGGGGEQGVVSFVIIDVAWM